MLEVDDSLKFALDFFGYFGSALASGYRGGEPLGSGGKIPLFYNQRLYTEAPFDRAHLVKPDLRPQYGDFSYIPLWQPTQYAMRTQYRFYPRLWGSLSLSYSDDPVRTEAVDQVPAPELGEAFLRWAPESAPGLDLAVGSLETVGSYCPIFDVFPSQQSTFAGLRAAYRRPFGKGAFEADASGGKTLVGRTKRQVHYNTLDLGDPGNSQFLDGVRDRIRMAAGMRYLFPQGLYAGLRMEYQVLAEDSTTIVPLPAAVQTYHWRRSEGWLAGTELGYQGRVWSHHIALSQGNGDVQMPWSGPDAVYKYDRSLPEDSWSRAGSKLTYAFYWGGFHSGRWGLELGAWGQWRQPSRDTSLPIFNLGDTVASRFSNQDFRAVRVAVEPRFKAFGPLVLGLRYDRILYLDPDAHTNTREPLTDRALRPIMGLLSNGDSGQVEGPSPWEREAADVHLASPFVQMDLWENFHVRAAWSGAWYSAEVTRSKVASDFHANLTLAAWITYRFSKREEEF